MVPKSSFIYSFTGLIGRFTDTSTNTPTSWKWKFGFGSPQNSQYIQNPVVEFIDGPGEYEIKLTPSNADGDGDPIITTIIVSDKIVLGTTIKDMVKRDLPAGVTYDAVTVEQKIQEWQLYIQPLLYNPKVVVEDVFTETEYPPIANILVAKLVIYDLFYKQIQAAITAAMSLSSTVGSTTTTRSGVQGPLKKIETGPSNAEWYDPTSILAELIRAGSHASSSQNSFISMSSEICMIARRIDVQLPMCPALVRTTVFSVLHKPKVNWNWPWNW